MHIFVWDSDVCQLNVCLLINFCIITIKKQPEIVG